MAWEQRRSTTHPSWEEALKREIRQFLEVIPKLTLEERVKFCQGFHLSTANLKQQIFY